MRSTGRAQNILGRPGAAFADLAMQFFGLGDRRDRLPARHCRLEPSPPASAAPADCASWPPGSAARCCFATALSCLPVLDKWPLPTGLGGAAGDVVLGFPEWFGGGELSGGLYAALFVVLDAASRSACSGCRHASSSADRRALGRRAPRTGDRRRRKTRRRSRTRGRECRRSQRCVAGILEHSAGFLAHWALSLQGAWSRDSSAPAALERAAEHARAATAARSRREPQFRARTATDAEEFDSPRIRNSTTLSLKRSRKSCRRVRETKAVVTPPAPRPKPSARVKKRGAALAAALARISSCRRSHLLSEPPKSRRKDPAIDQGALEQNARLLEGVLEDFGVRGEIINVRPGPVVTLYELEPAPGIKSSRVISLADDIARSMSAISAASPSSPARTPSASSCRTRTARRSISASCSPRPTSTARRPSSRLRSARPSAASRSSPTSPRCRISSSPAPPAPASRCRSTP